MKKLTLLLLVVILLTACQPAATPQPTNPSSAATMLSPTENPTPLPTAVPALTPTLMPTLAPEKPVSSIEDIVGIWRIWIAGDPNELRFLPDGRFIVNENSSIGTVAVEGSQLHFLTESYCPSAQEAYYMVYVTKKDNMPIKLRFVLVGEDGCPERKDALAGKTLLPVKP